MVSRGLREYQNPTDSSTMYADDEILGEVRSNEPESDDCNETDPLLPLFSAAHLG